MEGVIIAIILFAIYIAFTGGFKARFKRRHNKFGFHVDNTGNPVHNTHNSNLWHKSKMECEIMLKKTNLNSKELKYYKELHGYLHNHSFLSL